MVATGRGHRSSGIIPPLVEHSTEVFGLSRMPPHLNDRHQYRGDLEERPLAEILHTIYQYRVSGVVQVTRGDEVKRVYVRDGAVVYASSSDRRESLGHFLLRKGRISRQVFKTTMRQRRDSDERLGSLLVDQGLMSSAELQRAIRQQTIEILWNLFAWSAGAVTFTIGDFHEPSAVMIQVPMQEAIKEGALRMDNAAALLGRVGADTTILEPSYRTEDLIPAALRQNERELLQRVDGRRSIHQLCEEAPMGAVKAANLLYVFHVLGFVRVGERGQSGSIKIQLKSVRP